MTPPKPLSRSDRVAVAHATAFPVPLVTMEMRRQDLDSYRDAATEHELLTINGMIERGMLVIIDTVTDADELGAEPVGYVDPLATCTGLPFRDIPGVCDHCGTELTGRRKRWCSIECTNWLYVNHDWTSARRAARRRDGGCVKCGERMGVEVNHIEPRVGQGYGFGCWNHQENLETLCHPHHVEVTNAQRAARRAASS